MVSCLLAAALLVAPVAAAGSLDGGAAEASDGGAREHIDWFALPLLTYNSDTGLAYGAATQVQGAGGADPYRFQIAAQVLRSTGGLSAHYLRYDVPRLLGTQIRLWTRVEYHREVFAPYYGAGNQSSSRLADHPGLSGDHPFTYDRTLPTGRVGFGFPLNDCIHLVTFLGYTHVGVKAYPGSLLAQLKPSGFEGGDDLQASVGAYYDGRDLEAVPTRGSLVEIGARGASKYALSDSTYAGVTARYLHFSSPHPRTVLAVRFEGDLLSHDAPFWALQSFGATDTIEGVGGQYSARGIPQNRYIGRAKVVSSVELRWRLFEKPLFGENANFGLVGFLDAGRVWELEGDDGPFWKIHPGYGGGVRLWRRSLVLRMDVASSPDRPLSLYFVFGHFF
jgi:outer membrane protein assembly factor BamA